MNPVTSTLGGSGAGLGDAAGSWARAVPTDRARAPTTESAARLDRRISSDIIGFLHS